MPFDGKPSAACNATYRQAADLEPGRPSRRTSLLFGMDGEDWRGFFFTLTGLFALVLGMAAMVLATIGH